LRAGERLTTQAGLDDLSPTAWTDLGTSIKKIPSSGSATFALDVDFDCSGYDSAITIPTGTNVTIHGNGAVLDAAQQGRFFNVGYGTTLALDHLTLQRGSVSGDVSASFIDSSSCSWDDVNGPSVLRNFRFRVERAVLEKLELLY
jgi:hypothetical protein